MSIPINLAAVRSWEVARMALPVLVLPINQFKKYNKGNGYHQDNQPAIGNRYTKYIEVHGIVNTGDTLGVGAEDDNSQVLEEKRNPKVPNIIVLSDLPRKG